MRNHLSHSFNPAPPILTCNPVPSNTSKAPSPCITTRTTCTTLDFSRVVAVAPGTRTPTAGLIIMICYFFALRGTLRAVPADGVSRRSEGVEPESKLAVRFPRARRRRDSPGRVMDRGRAGRLQKPRLPKALALRAAPALRTSSYGACAAAALWRVMALWCASGPEKKDALGSKAV